MARDSLEAYVDAASAVLSLPIEEAWKPAIRANVEVIFGLAALVAEFPLADAIEPAPVFEA